MGTNILMLYEQENVTQQGVVSFFEAFSNYTNGSVKAMRSSKVKAKDVSWSDIVLFIRSNTPVETQIAKIAKKAKRLCISYWDDYVLEPYEGLVMPQRRIQALRELCTVVDISLSPNHELATKLAEVGKNVRAVQIDTVVDESAIADYQPEVGNGSTPIKIVYAAGPAHDSELNFGVEDALLQIHEEYGNVFTLTCIWAHPPLTKLSKVMQVNYLPAMAVNDYRAHMIATKYDIGLAPLHENLVTRYKYYNKFVEYTMSGVPAIFSNCRPNTLVVKDGVNGLLAEENVESWQEAIIELLKNSEKRKVLIRNAQDDLRKISSFNGIADSLICDVPELVTYKAPNVKICSLWLCKIRFYLFKFVYLPTAYSRREGVRNMIIRGIKHIKILKISK